MISPDVPWCHPADTQAQLGDTSLRIFQTTSAIDLCMATHSAQVIPLDKLLFHGPISTPTFRDTNMMPRLAPSPHPTSPSSSLAITDFRGYGSIWDAFSVQDDTGLPLLLKLCCPQLLPREPWYDARSGGYTDLDARSAVREEVGLYLGRLGSVQGVVVPRVYGVFGAVHEAKEVWAMVMEDAGLPMERSGMTWSDK